jgi:hypothetical protein
VDSSTAVNENIRAQFAAPAPAVLVPAAPAVARPQVRIHQGSAETTTATAVGVVPCPKHRGQPAAERCVVCGKPICPLCMKMFGYVCSPLCRQKAELTGVEVPEYELQNSVLDLVSAGGFAAAAGIYRPAHAASALRQDSPGRKESTNRHPRRHAVAP